MSLRATSEVTAREILEAWLSTEAPDPSEAENIEKVRALDRERDRPQATAPSADYCPVLPAR